jgi:probable rRNA maturation factor
MHINVQAIRVKTPVSERLIKSWVRAALQAPAKQTKRTDGPASELTIRFVGSTEGQHLNDQFRKKGYATNVLTFSYSKNPLVADIVLCTPVLRREAKAQQKTLIAHTAHLVVHGVLHARGFDHETASEANKMEACERQILHSLGFADPYADGAP